MCLHYVKKIIEVPEDNPIVAYKGFHQCKNGNLEFPIYPTRAKIVFNEWIENTFTSHRPKTIETCHGERYPSGFHANKKRKEVDFGWVILKVLLAGTVTIGKQGGYECYCASKMKIVEEPE